MGEPSEGGVSVQQPAHLQRASAGAKNEAASFLFASRCVCTLRQRLYAPWNLSSSSAGGRPGDESGMRFRQLLSGSSSTMLKRSTICFWQARHRADVASASTASWRQTCMGSAPVKKAAAPSPGSTAAADCATTHCRSPLNALSALAPSGSSPLSQHSAMSEQALALACAHMALDSEAETAPAHGPVPTTSHFQSESPRHKSLHSESRHCRSMPSQSSVSAPIALSLESQALQRSAPPPHDPFP
mmetsp:Transcript_6186/g.25782  ORF Transcript_6186/g.25782 Transcript_6186/m.25782 type:complete len:244 (+) Transcript_6186:505-1236(+)